jgi:hypothetical protein
MVGGHVDFGTATVLGKRPPDGGYEKRGRLNLSKRSQSHRSGGRTPGSERSDKDTFSAFDGNTSTSMRCKAMVPLCKWTRDLEQIMFLSSVS